MGIKEYIEQNEKLFTIGKMPIKYIFCDGNNSDKLIVTFPGFSSPKNPPKYNYIRTLSDCNCHRLYILDDYGPRGSYLIGKNRNQSIEESVMALILTICAKYNINSKNVILQGSSKGGYIALYYGIKYEFGNVITGAPQINLGNYLLYVAPEVAKYIAGGTEKEDIMYLNSFLYDYLNDESIEFPKIFIHVGKGDHHYKGHIIPFLSRLKDKGINYEINVKEYFSHNSIGYYYPEYLLKTLHNIDNKIISCNSSIKSEINYENGLFRINCYPNDNNLKYACHLYKENEIIEKVNYQKQSTFEFINKLKGIFRAKLYVKDKFHVNSTFTDEIKI